MQVVPKNARATIRVQVARSGDEVFLDVRTWTDPGDGEPKPTRKGVTVPMRSIQAFVAAIEAAGKEERARAA